MRKYQSQGEILFHLQLCPAPSCPADSRNPCRRQTAGQRLQVEPEGNTGIIISPFQIKHFQGMRGVAGEGVVGPFRLICHTCLPVSFQ